MSLRAGENTYQYNRLIYGFSIFLLGLFFQAGTVYADGVTEKIRAQAQLNDEWIKGFVQTDYGWVSLSFGEDWGIKIWNTRSGEFLGAYPYSLGPLIMVYVPACRFVGAKNWVAAGCQNFMPITIIDIASGQPIHLPGMGDHYLEPLATYKDLLLTRRLKSSLEVRSLESVSPLIHKSNFASDVRAFDISDTYLATLMDGGRIDVWSSQTGAFVRQFESHHEGASAVKIIGEELVTTSGRELPSSECEEVNGALKVWSLDSGKLLKHFVLPDGPYSPNEIIYRDNTLIARGKGDGSQLHIWDWPIRKVKHYLPVGAISGYGYYQGRLYVGKYKEIQVIDPATYQVLQSFPLAINPDAMIIHHDGIWLAEPEGKVSRLNPSTGEVQFSFQTSLSGIVELHRDQSQLLLRGENSAIEVWDLETGKRTTAWKDPLLKIQQVHFLAGRVTILANAQAWELWDIAQRRVVRSFVQAGEAADQYPLSPLIHTLSEFYP